MEKIKQTFESGKERISEVTGIGGQNTLTRQTGCPVGNNKHSLTAGPNGPVLLQDVHLLEKMAQFAREKIPARNVHALGTGAYGSLTITNNDLSKYTKAKVFSKAGKKTDIFVRFSGIFTEQGDADTSRDPRGFAIKFYTDEGNWDLLAINTPVFNVRDTKPGPDAVHAFKRNPNNGLWDPTQTWDFALNHPEGLHQMLMLFSDRCGTPLSYRYMHGYGCNTFSFINDKGERFWIKFHLICQQPGGAKGLNRTDAKLVAGEDPNFLSRDLWSALDRGDKPKWKFCFQIMSEEEGYRRPEAFDCTKVWRHSEFPLIDIGILELDRNPVDYFTEVEQVAFSPANVVPGIGYSPDRLLQGRLALYDDTQHHRLGPNFKMLDINRPHGINPNTMMVGGAARYEKKNPFPHYYPNSFGGPKPDESVVEPPLKCDGPAGYYDYPGEDDYYTQPGLFYKVLDKTSRDHLCDNIAASLYKVLSDKIIDNMIKELKKVDQDLGGNVQKLLDQRRNGSYKVDETESVTSKLNAMLCGKRDIPKNPLLRPEA